MTFVLGINEVLDFCHLKLSYSEQSLPGIDLISETESNLGTSERHLSIVEIIESSKIEEDSLCGLRPKISLKLTCWTDLTAKH